MENKNSVPTLFAHDGGRWEVMTESSRYIIDLNERTITRVQGSGPEHHKEDRVPSRAFSREADRHPARSRLRKDEQQVPLLDMSPVFIGHPLKVLLDIVGNGIVTVRRSTPVVSILAID